MSPRVKGGSPTDIKLRLISKWAVKDIQGTLISKIKYLLSPLRDKVIVVLGSTLVDLIQAFGLGLLSHLGHAVLTVESKVPSEYPTVAMRVVVRVGELGMAWVGCLMHWANDTIV